MTLRGARIHGKGIDVMRVTDCVMAVAMAALATTATAQTTAAPATPAPPVTQTGTSAPTYVGTTSSHWTASGFVGANFGENVDRASFDFGGQLAYLWNGVIGAELLADFAPRFEFPNAFLDRNPSVNAYMANAIMMLPLGSEGQFEPYVSGGVGAIQLRADVLTVETQANPIAGAAPIATLTTTTADESRFGGNIGGGFMTFARNIGFRADVRYYRATDDNTLDIGNPVREQIAQTILSGINFWRANAGLAFRW